MKTAKLGWKVWLLYGVLTLLPLVVTAVAVAWFLPDTIPAHYGVSGEVDRWGSKYECFIFPLLILPFGGLMLGIAKAASMEIWQSDGKGKKAVLISGVIGLLVFHMVDYFFLYTSWAQVENLGEVPEIGLRILFLFIGLLFIALGAAMPLVKQNSWFGIRTKWTLESETVWAKSQRFGGKLYVCGGIVTLVGLFFPQWLMITVTWVALVAATIGAVLYARREGRKEQSQK